MACARCDFYLPKPSSEAQLLEAKDGLQRMLVQIPLTDDERAAVEGDQTAVDRLIDLLADTPTPAGATPREIAATAATWPNTRKVPDERTDRSPYRRTAISQRLLRAGCPSLDRETQPSTSAPSDANALGRLLIISPHASRSLYRTPSDLSRARPPAPSATGNHRTRREHPTDSTK